MSFDIINVTAMTITNIVGVIFCFYFFDGFLDRKEHKELHHTLFLAIVSTVLVILNNIIKDPNMFVLVALITYSIIVIYSFAGNLFIRLASGLFFVIFGVVTELLTALIMSISLSMPIQAITENVGLFVVGSIISKLMMLFLIKTILKFTKKKAHTVSNRYWVFMLTIPLVSMYIILIIVHNNVLTSNNHVSSFWASVAALYINIVSFFLFDVIIRKVEENTDFRFANQQLSMQQEHYHNIIEGHKVTRGLWHDMKNNLIAIHTFLEHQDIKSALGAVEFMNEDLKNTSKAILSGNMVIDALLNNKISVAKAQGIEFITTFTVPSTININSLDLCMILGNALDNAIESCTKITDKYIEKKIEIKVFFRQDSLIISVSNPYEQNSLHKSDGKFLSSKQKIKVHSIDQWHGYGLYNMEKAIHRNFGNMIISTENNIFSLNIIIPITN